MGLAGHVERLVMKENIRRGLVGKPERRRPLRSYTLRPAIMLNFILQRLGGGGVDWIELA
jgi:hypothetical protein